MELSTKYDEIQTQIEAEEADVALTSDRVQTEDNLCNIECKLQHLLEQAEHMNQKPVINAESKQSKTTKIQLEPIKLPRMRVALLNGNIITIFFSN